MFELMISDMTYYLARMVIASRVSQRTISCFNILTLWHYVDSRQQFPVQKYFPFFEDKKKNKKKEWYKSTELWMAFHLKKPWRFLQPYPHLIPSQLSSLSVSQTNPGHSPGVSVLQIWCWKQKTHYFWATWTRQNKQPILTKKAH